MSSRILVLIAAGVVGLFLAACEFGAPGDTASLSSGLANADHKVLVCHPRGFSGQEPLVLSVDEHAVPAHLAHGDTLVAEEVCDDLDNDCDGLTDEDAACLCEWGCIGGE